MAVTADSDSTTDGNGLGRPLVLIIDDEAAIRAVASRALALFGMETVVASDGEEGAAIFAERSEEVSCVLLDMSMPRLDGEQTLLRLRAHDPSARVVLMTGYPVSEAEARFGGMGLSGFLQKPFELDGLRHAVESVVGR